MPSIDYGALLNIDVPLTAGDRAGKDLSASAPLAGPVVRYKIRGRYASATEAWVDSSLSQTSPAGHATTETGHTKSVG